jgi:hypothetical protein
MTPGRPVIRHSAHGLTVLCFSTSIRMRGQFSELTETLGSGSGRLLKPLPKEPRKQPPVLEPPQPCGSAASLAPTS